MGAKPWSCFVPYQDDIEAALSDERDREFKRLQENGFDEDEFGNVPETIDELLEQAAESGVGSVLDMIGVSEGQEFLHVAPLESKYLKHVFGTDEPTHEIVAENHQELFSDLDRGYGVYVIVYNRGLPAEILFAGYSMD